MNESLNPIFIQSVNVFLNPFAEDQIEFQEPSLLASIQQPIEEKIKQIKKKVRK